MFFKLQIRHYKPIWQSGLVSSGRCLIAPKGVSAISAWAQLNRNLLASRFQNKFFLQQTFEPKPDRRRRKRKQADWGKYLTEMRKQVKQAHLLKNRIEKEEKNYSQL